jgi:hypothetical protein
MATSMGSVAVKADSWAEPVKKESVKKTKRIKIIRTLSNSKTTKTVRTPTKKKISKSTKISKGTKTVETVETVSNNITQYKKGSRIKTVTSVCTITTTRYTYKYYYDLAVQIPSNGRADVRIAIDVLSRYCSSDIIQILKAQKVKIYLYSTCTSLKKAGIVGTSVWDQKTKAIYIRNNEWYVLLHEVAHLLDCYAEECNRDAKQYSSSSEYFQSVFQKDRKKVSGTYQNSVKEYFAEAVMYYYLRPTTLRTERPDTYDAVKQFLQHLS